MIANRCCTIQRAAYERVLQAEFNAMIDVVDGPCIVATAHMDADNDIGEWVHQPNEGEGASARSKVAKPRNEEF